MKINLTQLGPLVLPLSEQLKVVHSLIRHKMGGSAPRYVPSFKSAIHFFCIHAGGATRSQAPHGRRDFALPLRLSCALPFSPLV